MLLDVKGVELASTVDHVTVIEMNAIARLAGLNLLRRNRRIFADDIVYIFTLAYYLNLRGRGRNFQPFACNIEGIISRRKLRNC